MALNDLAKAWILRYSLAKSKNDIRNCIDLLPLLPLQRETRFPYTFYGSLLYSQTHFFSYSTQFAYDLNMKHWSVRLGV